MGVRSSDHQLVTGKQYFQDEVQLNTGVNAIVHEVTCNSGTTKVFSGAMVVPAGSVITRLTAVVTSAITASGAGTHGVKFGKTEDSHDFTGAIDADSLKTSSASVAAGVGTSTDTVLMTALGGNAIIGALASAGTTADQEVHGSLIISANTYAAADTGKIKFIVEYVS